MANWRQQITNPGLGQAAQPASRTQSSAARVGAGPGPAASPGPSVGSAVASSPLAVRVGSQANNRPSVGAGAGGSTPLAKAQARMPSAHNARGFPATRMQSPGRP